MTKKQVKYLVVGGGPGGTCLFEGCIPSKIFRESARRLRELNEVSDFGLCLPSLDVGINWSAILQRKRTILQRRSQAALHNTERLPTLETVFAQCRLLGPRTAEVISDDHVTQELQFEKAILATGSTPFLPPIIGIDHPRVFSSDSILDIDHIPERLVVIGAGPIGVELGQVFRTLGSKVTILEAAPHILGPVDAELAALLQQRMQTEGIHMHMNCQVDAIVHSGQCVFVGYHNEANDKRHEIADAVLVVTGRRPNVDGLDLENTQIKHDTRGLKVDARLETEEAGIFAVGDVIGQPMFAHWATAQGLALARHLLNQPVEFPAPDTNTAVIFSEPEIGIASVTEQQAQQAGMEVAVARYDFNQDARAQIAGRDNGLLKIVYTTDTHKIVGVHALVEGAGPVLAPMFVLGLGMPQQLAQGCSLLSRLPPVISGVWENWRLGNIHPGWIPPLALGAIVGAFLGSKIALTLPEQDLRIAFGILLIALGLHYLHGSRNPHKPLPMSEWKP